MPEEQLKGRLAGVRVKSGGKESMSKRRFLPVDVETMVGEHL